MADDAALLEPVPKMRAGIDDGEHGRIESHAQNAFALHIKRSASAIRQIVERTDIHETFRRRHRRFQREPRKIILAANNLVRKFISEDAARISAGLTMARMGMAPIIEPSTTRLLPSR